MPTSVADFKMAAMRSDGMLIRRDRQKAKQQRIQIACCQSPYHPLVCVLICDESVCEDRTTDDKVTACREFERKITSRLGFMLFIILSDMLTFDYFLDSGLRQSVALFFFCLILSLVAPSAFLLRDIYR